MIVGVPKEIKRDEYRVAMLPVGVEEMVRSGHTVLVEQGAGLGSGLPDEEYDRQGAEMEEASCFTDSFPAIDQSTRQPCRRSSRTVLLTAINFWPRFEKAT